MRLFHKLTRRLRLLLAYRSVERDMDDEMQSHLREAARELEHQGWAPAEALRRARVAFGGVEHAKEDARDARGGRLLQDLVADTRYAFHQAVRTPLHAMTIVALVGVAIAGASLSFALARAYLLRPLPVPEPDRMVTVIPAPSRALLPTPPNLAGVDWTSVARLFEETAAWDLDGFTLVNEGSPPAFVDGSWVSPGYFELLAVRLTSGRRFAPGEYVPGSNVALISEELWHRRFAGDPGVIGASVRMHSTDRPEEDALVTIVGVLAPTDWQLHRFTEILRPLGTPRMFSLARLPSGVTAADAASRLTTLVRSQASVSDSTWAMSVVSTQEEYVLPIRPVITVLMGAALLLLLLAQASAGALLLARSTARVHELSVRRALGATRGRVARQLVTEAGVLIALAFGLGLGLTPILAGAAASGMEQFGRVAVPGGVGSVGLDRPVVLALLLVTAVPFALLALSPMLRLMAHETSGSFSRGTPVRDVVRMRRVLSTLQVTVAVVLLAQGALLGRSMRAILRADLGFQPAQLLKAHVLLPRDQYPDAHSRRMAARALIERIRQVPGVVDAAVGHPHPFRAAPPVAVECDGCRGGGMLPRAVSTTVSHSYFGTMGVPLLTGRVFDQRDLAEAEPVAVVSEALSRRFWGSADASGRRLRLVNGETPGPWLTVVGVTKDVRKTYGDSLLPDVYRPFEQAPRAYTAVLVRTRSDPASLERPIREAVARDAESLALSDVEPMALLLRSHRGPAQVLAIFVGGIALLAFGLTVLGLAAVVGYLVRLRRREFAVRVALGASPRQIVRAVFGEARGMLGVGLALGTVLAWAATGLTRATLVGISPRDPATYATVVLLVIVVTLVALAVPARRAARVNPTISLREE